MLFVLTRLLSLLSCRSCGFTPTSSDSPHLSPSPSPAFSIPLQFFLSHRRFFTIYSNICRYDAPEQSKFNGSKRLSGCYDHVVGRGSFFEDGTAFILSAFRGAFRGRWSEASQHGSAVRGSLPRRNDTSWARVEAGPRAMAPPNSPRGSSYEICQSDVVRQTGNCA